MQTPLTDQRRFSRSRSALRVTFYYALFGIAWILFSDWAVRLMAVNADMLHSLQNAKGLAYVGLSALLILALIRHENRNTVRATQALAEERERLAGILEGIRVGTWEWHIPSGRTVFNERWAEMIGYDLAELTPTTIQTWERLVHPEDLPKALSVLQQHLNGEQDFYDVEFRMRHRDGHWIWVHDRGRVLEWTGTGEPVRMLGTHTDISQRKRNEAEIAHTNRLYATLSETNQAIVRFTDQDALLQHVCEIAVKYGGFRLAWIGLPDADGWLQVAAASGKTDYLGDLLVSIDPTRPEGGGPSGRAFREGRRRINNDFSHNEDARPWHKRAAQVGFGASAAFPLVSEGKVFGVFNIYADTPGYFQEREITLLEEMAADIGFGVENHRRRYRQIRSEARFHAIANGFPDAIVLADVERRIEWINPGFEQTFGYRLEEIKGESTRILYAGEADFSEQGRLHYSRYATPANSPYEVIYRRRDGGEFVGETIGTPLKDENGELLGYVAVIRDITERRRTEEQLRIAAAAFEVENGIMITDHTLRIEKVNRAFSRITGYDAVEVVGHTPDILRSDRHSARFYERMWQEIRDNGYWQGEIWNRKKDGEIYPEWLSISVIRDTAGEVTHYIGSFTDISDRKAAEQRIHQLAFYDPLTQLANRRLFIDRLEHARVTSERAHQHGAILMLDLDHFKLLNDTQGHHAGDELLIEVGRRIRRQVRDSDTVARLGGDEFVVLLEALSQDRDQAAGYVNEIAVKIHESLIQPYSLSGSNDYRITPSLGVTLFQGRTTSMEELLKQADVALYEGKSAGRNTIRFFNPDMQRKVDQRASMETALARALDQGEFQLHYQPQINRDGELLGAEVLLRWIPEEGGPVSPAEFIPLAEDTGLIVPIGYWVLETACQQLSLWQRQHPDRDLSMAVNISARQFHQHDFIRRLQDIIERSGADPRGLKLELTESVVLDDIAGVIEKIEGLRQLGLGFSMDDFGTGYSSLSYLKRLPLDQLKIDTSFVRDLAHSANDLAIVRAIIAMGHSLNLHVIAEGVETAEQKVYLERYGCDAYQGYLFGRPMPAPEFEAGFITAPAAQTPFRQR
ncbi:EAL domain-containing protein [Thiohalobacter thiocyanaticus]|uniref:cyclic-guanylate-specific phosphodiesterase n=1 Tax=Thiohalobacter thiocyanaticus TaxID=585455 RepID=A0A426QGA3_9GAMM|nr:EAL domain-containing protein [Thiohalobacter thiocyanaticus]RRQ20774.1 EAL domain-containing protein [Thiohalobacter thiocyanaticus]